MLYLPNANTNDNIKVLNISDSYKLYSIPNGKHVILEFTSIWPFVGKSGGKWRRMTGKMVRSVQISDDWKTVPLEKNELFFDALMVSVIQML